MTAIPLSRLGVGQTARIDHIRLGVEFSTRLRALGLTPGQTIGLLRQAPWRGPLHLRVGRTEIMLRRDQAQHIQVTPNRD